MRRYAFDQNAIFIFLSNKPIISGFKKCGYSSTQLDYVEIKDLIFSA
jgi:hypothetical protein